MAMHRMRSGVLWGLLACGCGPSLIGDSQGQLDGSSSSTDATTSVGPDPTLTTVAPTTTMTTTPTTTIDPTGDPICPTFNLGSSVPNSVSSVIDDEVDQFSGSCGGAAVDAVLSFTAPQDGDYTFSTAGTSYDTVLYVLDGLCGGGELDCNDDTPFDTSSELTVSLFAGQVVSVVIDGFSPGVTGAWHVDVALAEAQCPDFDLESFVPTGIGDSTQGAGNAFSPSCVGDDGAERRYLWTAPYTGVFTFDNEGSEIFSAVYVMAGVCEGAQIACDAGQLEPASGVSGVVASLAADQTVTVVVDGLFGNSGFTSLNVDELLGVCPVGSLGSSAPQTIFDDTNFYANSGGRSCGGWFARDATYTWSAPADGTYRFEITDASFPWVLAVQDGVCQGAELGCVDASFGGSIVVDAIAGQLFVVAVDGLGHQSGPFTLSVQADTCPELDLGGDVPISVVGSIVGASATSQGSCAPTTGPDVGYRFVAPFAATYQFDTIGSDYDTVLTVRDSSCGGVELACDDDLGGNLSSLVTLDLAAGQTVIVGVDGFDGDVGGYVLRAQAF
ncbi:MAG TPA: hypothetical protein VG755_18125 [Nannocystaceae bacterium]|nr:hypothetical protein [Nannocystaceae bacterium]